MTTSKAKRKKKTRMSKAIVSSACEDKQTGFTNDIAHAESWDLAVDLLCQYLTLPDITTQRGLKETLDSFDSIYNSLDPYLDSEDDRTAGAAVSVYAKMSVDWKIRELLLKKGILSRMESLLQRPFCRMIALQAYVSMTYRNRGSSPKVIEEKTTATLLGLIAANPTDSKLVELSFATLSQSSSHLFPREGINPSNEMKKAAHVSEIVRAFVEHAKNPDCSYYLLSIAYGFLDNTVTHCGEELMDFPPAIDLMLTCLRSKDTYKRIQTVVSFNYFNFNFDTTSFDYDFERFQSIPHIVNAENLSSNRHPSGEEVNLPPVSRSSPNIYDAILCYDAIGDYDSLAPILRYLVLHLLDEMFSGSKCIARVLSPEEVPPGSNSNVGLVEFSDIFQRCISALRQKYRDIDQETLAILEITYYLQAKRYKQVSKLALDVNPRFPHQPFFYYVIGAIGLRNGDTAHGLYIAKKGLERCNETTTPRLRYFLRHLAGVCGVQFGCSNVVAAMPFPEDGIDLQKAQEKADGWWAESLGPLTDAFEDLNNVINDKTDRPDASLKALYWYMVVLIALKGHQLSDDLTELKDIASKLSEFDELYISKYGRPPEISQDRLRCLLILTRLKGASAQWKSTIERFDELHEHAPDRRMPLLGNMSPNRTTDDWREWFYEGFWLKIRNPSQDSLFFYNRGKMGKIVGKGDPMEYSDKPQRATHFNRRTIPNAVELHVCSSCHNPSASLKRCTRCGKARYCDSKCQREHWHIHRHNCQRD